MVESTTLARRRPGHERWLPWAVLAISLLLTGALCTWSWHAHRAEVRALLERRVEAFGRALSAQVQSYVDTLPGLRVFGVLQKSPTDAEFRQYVEAISLQRRFPGLALTFVADLVGSGQRAAYVGAVRADRSLWPEGHPRFDIRPPGERAQAMVLRHLHPYTAASLGYDLYDPAQNYRADVDVAIDSGSYVATGPLRLAQHRDKPDAPALNSVVIRAATYDGGGVPTTLQARRAAAHGVVGISFSTLDLVNSVMPRELAEAALVRIVDPRAQAAGGPYLLFDAAWAAPEAADARTIGHTIHFSAPVADRRWDIAVTERAPALPLDGDTAILLVLGAALSLALAAMTRTLVDARLGAEQRVREGLAALRAEQGNLARSESRYRMLYANSLDAVLQTRPTGDILGANAAACRLFGRSEAELQTVGRGALVDAHDPRLAALMERRQRTGRSQGLCRMRRADGSVFEAEIASAVYADSDGQPAASVIVRDVTERQMLAAHQQRLTAILDATPDFVASFDPQGRSIFLNLAGRLMLGRGEADDLSSLGIADWHPPWAARLVREVGLPAALRDGSWSGRSAILAGDGSERPVSQVILCHRDAQGSITHLSTIAHDLSELEQAQRERQALESRMREAQKMDSIGTLAGGVAHDFNNVLVAILGNALIARQQLPAEHAAQAGLALIEQAAARARTLVQQILTFSRRSPQQRTVLSLRAAVEEALALLRTTLPSTAQLGIELVPAVLPVLADASQMQQVVLNLCTNAWQALGGRQGRIDVRLDEVEFGAGSLPPVGLTMGRYARLQVADNGDGMDEATRGRIFEPFFTTKAVGQGTGLGLSVVHGIVAASGGAITVDSEPGVGTTFHAYLPLVEQLPLPEAAAEPAAPATGRLGHVLYVDDDEVVTITMVELMRRAGHRVTSLPRAQEAVEAVRADPARFDLVLTDHNMPGMSGLALAAILRDIAPALPVVITSGYVTEDLRQQARRAGARGVVSKEFSVERLSSVIEQFIAAPAPYPTEVG